MLYFKKNIQGTFCFSLEALSHSEDKIDKAYILHGGNILATPNLQELDFAD